MQVALISEFQQVKRDRKRSANQTFVRLRPMDEPEGEGMIGLTTDFCDNGVTMLTYIPLPVGLRCAIDAGDEFVALGEVIDWEWDYNCDMARLGIRLLELKGQWPI